MTYCSEHDDELAAVWAPFDDEADDEAGDPRNLKPVIAQVMSAVWQIASTGTPGQREAAVDILADTRRRLYGVLADGDEA
ncbi:hypothetical protein [Nocardioides alcanivorans]|uniref:hypothetical protein n=1 Tax=Nocardioides alcanivorans TaxID=2897352 RepID=UPI001F2B3650|nr:hypothetical protein [Nocardioides alcanivorans]